MLKLLCLPLQDSQGNIVRERLSGKELIHNDGNGFISEDLAELIPAGISQGCLPQERQSSEVRTGAFLGSSSAFRAPSNGSILLTLYFFSMR